MEQMKSLQAVMATLAASVIGIVAFEGQVGDVYAVIPQTLGTGESLTLDVLVNGVSILTAPVVVNAALQAVPGKLIPLMKYHDRTKSALHVGDVVTVSRTYVAGGGPAGVTSLVVLEPTIASYEGTAYLPQPTRNARGDRTMKDPYRDQLRNAFSNPAAGGNGRSGITIPSVMTPMQPERSYASLPHQVPGGMGLSLKDREIMRAVDAAAPDPFRDSTMSPDQQEAAWKARREAQVMAEKALAAPLSGEEATPLQAFYAGHDGAKVGAQASGSFGNERGVPDMRNHSRLPAPAVGYAPGLTGATQRSYEIEGDGRVFPGDVGDRPPPPKPEAVAEPTPATIRADGRFVGQRQKP